MSSGKLAEELQHELTQLRQMAAVASALTEVSPDTTAGGRHLDRRWAGMGPGRKGEVQAVTVSKATRSGSD